MKRLAMTLFICAAAAAQSANPLTDAILARYQPVRQNLIETAEVMPEDSYSFHPTPAQRPFGEWLSHVAMGNFHYCKVIMGPAEDHRADNVKIGATKAEIVKAVRDSFDFCDAALKDMNDKKALTQTTAGDKKVYPVEAMIGLVASANEHYGNLVAYLRAKGITPPSSAHAAKHN